ncbi:low temperature requirement protein A [Micromonospora parathelypteridis]|uniref:Low temperature requirement protein LtrA n=1 Tax=Micromonospora parathelypteridis TaxID=1839617 RepID=A0A840VSE5_9ACTN|nr:low temperature requirement protein A [Micromonospora parathelypteridis]MBB5480173.1 low temperature requirement protein LtrA [Micromonospora parathelypteridis]GGO24608.1 membrane protein [Micromonospora parathelypteridis]
MANGLPGRLLQRRENPRRASFLELFFDLAFIFALSRLSQALLDDSSLNGGFRVLLMLAALWWVWFVTAWSADWFDPRTPLIVALLLWVMLGGLLMAAAVPTAFGRHALVFAIAYVAIHLGRAALLIPALRGHPLQLRTVRVAVWFAISGVLWVVGAAVAPAREVLWALALVMEFSLARLRWPFAGLGRSSWPDLQVNGTHLSERYQQVFIIALGELILMSGVTYSGSGLDRDSTVAFVLAFVTAVALARLYLVPAGARLGTSIEEAGPPGSKLALKAGYLHLVMIAGVLATSAGMEVSIANPGAREPARLVLSVTGPALFLTGRILLSALVDPRLPLARLIGVPLIILGGFASVNLPLVGTSGIVAGVLLLIVVLDALPGLWQPGRPARRTDG